MADKLIMDAQGNILDDERSIPEFADITISTELTQQKASTNMARLTKNAKETFKNKGAERNDNVAHEAKNKGIYVDDTTAVEVFEKNKESPGFWKKAR